MFVKENPDRKKKSRGKWRIYFRLYYAYYQQIDRVVVSGNGHIHKIKKSSLVRWIHLTKKAIYNHVYNIFGLFWWLCKFSFHNRWNEAWLLAINWYIPVTSRVAERLKTYQENLKTADNYCLLLSPFRKMKILLIPTKISWKTETELFHVVHYFTWKLQFASNILGMVIF